MSQIAAAAQLQPNDSLHSYWRHIELVLAQLQGLCDGYSSTEFGQCCF